MSYEEFFIFIAVFIVVEIIAYKLGQAHGKKH